MSTLVLLLLTAAVCSGERHVQMRMPPRREELYPDEVGSFLPKKQIPHTRNYRQVQQIDTVYKLPDEEIDNEVGPFEANKLILGDPAAMTLHAEAEMRGRRVARSLRRPRAVFSTNFEYGRPYRALPRLLHRTR